MYALLEEFFDVVHRGILALCLGFGGAMLVGLLVAGAYDGGHIVGLGIVGKTLQRPRCAVGLGYTLAIHLVAGTGDVVVMVVRFVADALCLDLGQYLTLYICSLARTLGTTNGLLFLYRDDEGHGLGIVI